MEQEFTTSTFYKIFYGVAAFLITGAAIFLFGNGTGQAGPALYIFPALMLTGSVAIFFNLYKRKVVISDYGVAYTSIWGIKELAKEDILGFRIGDKAITLEPAIDGYAKVMIRDYTTIGDSKDLIGMLRSNYKDLNQIEFNEAKELILQDEELGRTTEDRESKFKNLSLFTKVYSFISIGALIVNVYLHINNSLLSLFLLFYPLVGILIFGFGKGIIRMFSKKNSPYPAIGVGIVFAVFGLAMQANFSNEILDYQNFWTPFAVIGIMVFVLLGAIIIRRPPVSRTADVIFALIIAVGYGWGATLQFNCSFDSQNPQVYKATVLSRHITRGKSTSYHIILSEWGPHHQQDNVTVSQTFYSYAIENSQVNVNLKKGTFNIPWYYLTQ